MIDYHAIDTDIPASLERFERQRPVNYGWVRMVNRLAEDTQRTSFLLTHLQLELTAGSKILVISPRLKLCSELNYQLKRSGVNAAYLNGTMPVKERIGAVTALSNSGLLLVTTAMLAIPLEQPLEIPFNSVHFVLPTTFPTMLKQLRTASPLTFPHTLISATPLRVTYYVDNHFWLGSTAGRIYREFKKQTHAEV